MEQISVKTRSRRTIILEVESSNNVDNIKLTLPGKTFSLDVDNNFQIKYPQNKESNLHLDIHLRGAMQIFIETPSGKKITLQVDSFDSPQFIKSEIEKIEETPVIDSKLFFEGKRLEDHHTLEYYKITNESTLQLRGNMQIFIKTLRGQTIRLDNLDGSTTIKKLKEKIQAKETILWDMVRIFYSGRQLEDEGTLADYMITNNSTLNLVLLLLSLCNKRPCNRLQ